MVLCGSEDAKSENDGLAYAQKSVDKLSLTTELTRHLEQETASFHTPGHKGRPVQSASLPGTGEFIRFDLTELPGLDDLSNPVGVLANLESRLDTIFGAKHSSISCNGASAELLPLCPIWPVGAAPFSYLRTATAPWSMVLCSAD